MIDDCNINNLAKNQVTAVFNSRNKSLFNQLGRHVNAASSKSLEIQA